jgi:fatty-acyl-CoA synthase
VYFAGRSGDWLRVDGENFPAGPIEAALAAHPAVLAVAAYGVPDVDAGDQVMACVVLRDGAAFDGDAFSEWLDGLADVGPKWRPRYVRTTATMPTTGTNKIVKRQLAREKWLGDDDVWVRERGDVAYRLLTADDRAVLRDAFIRAGRERFLDL